MIRTSPPSSVLAIDPGLRGCGVALFWGGRLTEATYVQGPERGRGPEAWGAMADAVLLEFQPTRIWRPMDVLVESQQIYRAGRTESRPEDLLELRGVMATIARDYSRDGRVVSYKPAEWKGQVPKAIHHARILEKLSEGERAVVDDALARIPDGLAHNVLDAVGLGLAHLKRHRLRA